MFGEPVQYTAALRTQWKCACIQICCSGHPSFSDFTIFLRLCRRKTATKVRGALLLLFSSLAACKPVLRACNRVIISTARLSCSHSHFTWRPLSSLRACKVVACALMRCPNKWCFGSNVSVQHEQSPSAVPPNVDTVLNGHLP